MFYCALFLFCLQCVVPLCYAGCGQFLRKPGMRAPVAVSGPRFIAETATAVCPGVYSVVRASLFALNP